MKGHLDATRFLVSHVGTMEDTAFWELIFNAFTSKKRRQFCIIIGVEAEVQGKAVPARVNLREGGVCAVKEMARGQVRQGLHHLFAGMGVENTKDV